MSNSQIMEIQQGIWIDEHWLQSAGLGARIQVIVHTGEIRILSASDEMVESSSAEIGWNFFRNLGKNARPGKLRDASIQHDRYLYGKEK